MSNEDYFAQPIQQAPPALPAAYPVGASAQFASYSPDEQLALATSRSTSLRNMRGAGRRRMPLFERLGRGLTIARTTGAVVAQVPSLLVPGVVALALSAGVVVVGVEALGSAAAQQNSNLHLVVKVAVGATLAVISVLAQAVVIDASTERMQLGTPNLMRSWGKALSHLPDLVCFAVLCSFVNWLSSAVRMHRFGRFLADLIDDAWDFATLFAVPAVLYENLGPITAVRRSATLAGKRWPEQLVARGALALALFVLAIPLFTLIAVLAWSLGTVVALPLLLLLVVLLIVTSATLRGVLAAALYRYAVTGEVTSGFSTSSLGLIFRR